MSDDAFEGFTKAEVRLIVVMFKHTDATGSIDWDNVAKDYPYKDATNAKSRYSAAKKSRENILNGITSSGTNEASKPAKAKGTKRKATGEGKPTGAKRGRKPKAQDAAASEDVTASENVAAAEGSVEEGIEADVPENISQNAGKDLIRTEEAQDDVEGGES
ncbi:hypothetical protein MMC20_005818 [Loxospora ochrophaea]|nr:hypothetical protein [Loxospora ochrophaea]